MSVVRESSPISKPRVGHGRNAENPSEASHFPFTLSNRDNPRSQIASNDGGGNKTLANAPFAGLGKHRAVGTPMIQMYDQKSMPFLSLAPSQAHEKNSSSTPASQKWKQLTPQIAALVAVSKSLPVQSSSQLPDVPLRRMNLQKTQFDSATAKVQTDVTPIPATNSLIKLFESQKEDKISSLGGGFPHPQNSQPKTQRPQLARPSGTRRVDSGISSNAEVGQTIEKGKPGANDILGGTSWAGSSDKNALDLAPKPSSTGKSEESRRIASRRGPAPLPPPPRRTRTANDALEQDRQISSTFSHSSEGKSSASSYASAVASLELPSRDIKLTEDSANGRSNTSIPSNPQSQLLKLPRISLPASRKSFEKEDHLWVGRQYSHESILDPRSRKPQLTANSLANAMVASSLASSRASSPSKAAPSLPRRQSKAQSIFRRSQSQETVQSRTPSPGRVMRQTMRETPKSDEEESRKRSSGSFLNKHPNKHNEGNRKRWRDEIGERERKRYEGVWAANKGVLVPSEHSDFHSAVLDLVVRDIWRRSRLPDEVLAEVWDLVNIYHVGMLSKEEFVVGMWLIDQRLKGRKLPMKVSDSVWFSVKRLSGIKAPR